MKKALAIILSLVIVICAGVMAFAQGGFVSSPSGNDAPEIEEVSYEDGSCNPKIVVTPYKDRDTLDEGKEEDFDLQASETLLESHFSATLAQMGLASLPAAVIASGTLLKTLQFLQKYKQRHC